MFWVYTLLTHAYLTPVALLALHVLACCHISQAWTCILSSNQATSEPCRCKWRLKALGTKYYCAELVANWTSLCQSDTLPISSLKREGGSLFGASLYKRVTFGGFLCYTSGCKVHMAHAMNITAPTLFLIADSGNCCSWHVMHSTDKSTI